MKKLSLSALAVTAIMLITSCDKTSSPDSNVNIAQISGAWVSKLDDKTLGYNAVTTNLTITWPNIGDQTVGGIVSQVVTPINGKDITVYSNDTGFVDQGGQRNFFKIAALTFTSTGDSTGTVSLPSTDSLSFLNGATYQLGADSILRFTLNSIPIFGGKVDTLNSTMLSFYFPAPPPQTDVIKLQTAAGIANIVNGIIAENSIPTSPITSEAIEVAVNSAIVRYTLYKKK